MIIAPKKIGKIPIAAALSQLIRGRLHVNSLTAQSFCCGMFAIHILYTKTHLKIVPPVLSKDDLKMKTTKQVFV